jgi:hypothetical protein
MGEVVRRASPSTVTVLLLLGAVLGATLLVARPSIAIALGVLSGGALGAVLVVQSHPTRTRDTVASTLLLPAGGLACLALVSGLLTMGIVGVVVAACGVVTGIGIVGVLESPGAIGARELTRAWGSAFRSIAVAVGLSTVTLLLHTGSSLLTAGESATVSGLLALLAAGASLFAHPPYAGPHPEVLGFLVAALLWLLRSTIGVVPWQPLVPHHRRDAVGDGIASVAGPLRYGYWIAAALVVCRVVLLLLRTSNLSGTVRLVGRLDVVAGPPRLRALLFWACSGLAMLRFGVPLLRTVLTGLPRRFQRVGTRSAGVVLVGSVLMSGAVTRATVAPLLARLPEYVRATVQPAIDAAGFATVVLCLVAVVYAITLLVFFAVGVLLTGGFVDPWSIGPALASAGPVGIAVGLSLGDATALFVFGLTAAGFAIWGVGSYGVVVRAELDGTTAWRSESLHAAGTLVGAAAVVLVALGSLSVVRSYAVAGTTTVGVLASLSLAGVLFLAPYIRS